MLKEPVGFTIAAEIMQLSIQLIGVLRFRIESHSLYISISLIVITITGTHNVDLHCWSAGNLIKT